MDDVQKWLYCDGCFYLDLPEDHPNTRGHMCMKYKARVLHLRHHPHLVRLKCCKDEGGKEIKRFNRYAVLLDD